MAQWFRFRPVSLPLNVAEIQPAPLRLAKGAS
jgi:hypothetical protein